MQLSLPPEQNKRKLQQIQQQKKRLKDRIQRIQQTSVKSEKESTSSYQQNMAKLMQRKKRLQQQKERQFHLKKMQDEYIERRQQKEREKRMEELQNQKRMIELEVGIKRMVFEGTKEKVKGMNSEQLMMRAMLRDGQQEPHHKPYSSKGNVRRDFQQFLQTEHRPEYKQKWDIYELNEKRFQVFEKKQEALMRQVLLKQLITKGKDEDINVLKMNKKQLEQMLQALGIDIYDYVQQQSKPYPKYSNKPDSTNIVYNRRIQQHSRLQKIQKEEQQKLQKQKKKLKDFLVLKPADIVRFSKSIIYDIINDIVMDYEKRLNRYKVSEFEKVKKQLQNRYQTVLLQSQDYQYSKVLTLKLLEKIHQEYYEEAAEEVAKLHNWAHDRTEECFSWMFGRGTDITKKLADVAAIDFQLNFEDDGGEDYEPRRNRTNLKKQDYLRKFEDYQPNTFDVDKLTTQLINQINLLEVEANYFKNISIKIHGEKEGPDGNFHILYDRQFYAITNEAVHNAKKIKVKLQKLGIKSGLKMLNWQKFHNFWLIHDEEKVSLYSPWGLEVLPNQIGERVGNFCGKITCTQIFPIYTVLGMTCSIMLGFQKGQVLKYNMNMNRIQNSQSNLSFYNPILPQIKREQQPPFPLQKKNIIKYESKKITENSQIHQFRQFFDHHTSTVIGINFYKYNSFITVDKNFKCAIWYYDFKEGAKCYKTAYEFQFVCSYSVYQQASDNKFKNIYPGDRVTQSPQQMYQKWMQTQGFLKKQVYNNPKKNIAYFRVGQSSEQKGEVPLWIVTYNASESKVLKIHEEYFSAFPGKMEAKSTKIWKKYLMILGERQHSMRNDLKTIKVYGWDIEEKKMRSIGIQFDVYKNQNYAQFQILDNMLVGVDVQLMAIVSSGRILIFSLISGQLLRNISDTEFLQQPKYSSYYYTEITAKRSLLGAATKTNTLEISLNDHNNHQEQKQLNSLIDEVARKYINLI